MPQETEGSTLRPDCHEVGQIDDHSSSPMHDTNTQNTQSHGTRAVVIIHHANLCACKGPLTRSLLVAVVTGTERSSAVLGSLGRVGPS